MMIENGNKSKQILKTRVAFCAAIGLALGSVGGCQAYLDLRESVVRGRGDGEVSSVRSTLTPGAYAGLAACRRLSQVSGALVLEEFTLDVSITILDGGIPSPDGQRVVAGPASDIVLSTETISRMVAEVSAFEDFVTIAYDAETVIDASTSAPIELSGAYTESYEQASADELTFSLVAELSEEVGDAQVSEIMVTYECDAALVR